MRITFVAAALLFTMGCSPAPTPSPTPVATTPSPAPVADKDGYFTTPHGVKYKIIQEAPGIQATKDRVVRVHYTGTLQNGKKFDSSYDRNEPLTFTMGKGEVIPGWEEGLFGMRMGEKRKIIVPPAMAYGATGDGAVIPPNATLYFTIELLDVQQ
ncbi:FKBP-type peptidyl-prolyl cis-trans isomerase [bacterium]|nr:FKBP-type peptidyl-prolyl cis-trans isomerase [bacterium]